MVCREGCGSLHRIGTKYIRRVTAHVEEDMRHQNNKRCISDRLINKMCVFSCLAGHGNRLCYLSTELCILNHTCLFKSDVYTH